MSRSLDTLKTMGGAIKDETALQMVRRRLAGGAAHTWTSARPRSPRSHPSPPPPAPQRLLDDTGDKIDDGNTALKRETARVEHVIKTSSTCWLYTLICLLLVVVIVMAILLFKP